MNTAIRIIKTITIGILLGLAYMAIVALSALGAPMEIVPMVGGSLYVGTRSITRIKG